VQHEPLLHQFLGRPEVHRARTRVPSPTVASSTLLELPELLEPLKALAVNLVLRLEDLGTARRELQPASLGAVYEAGFAVVPARRRWSSFVKRMLASLEVA
jgi:hypothetical protein